MYDRVLTYAGVMLAIAAGVFAFATAVYALALTICGTFAFWSWVFGGPGFVAECLA